MVTPLPPGMALAVMALPRGSPSVGGVGEPGGASLGLCLHPAAAVPSPISSAAACVCFSLPLGGEAQTSGSQTPLRLAFHCPLASHVSGGQETSLMEPS